MRVKIEYYYNKIASAEFPFWAKSALPELKNELVFTCGTSWEDVRAKHRQKLADALIAPEAPLPEEIEL